jgi:hypothetical protein
MSTKTNIYNIENDITAININACCAQILIETASQKNMTVEYVENNRIHIASNDGVLIIKQDRRPFNLLKSKVIIKLSVPEYLVPTITFNGDRTNLEITNGIFKDMEYYADGGSLVLNTMSFDNIDIKGSGVNFKANNLMVKNNLLCSIRSGEAVIEHSFATHLECINKHGNLGVVELKCKDSLLSTQHGNVSATIVGDKSDYNITVSARKGTCNCESDEGNIRPCSIKAFAESGNILVEFIDDNKED